MELVVDNRIGNFVFESGDQECEKVGKSVGGSSAEGEFVRAADKMRDLRRTLIEVETKFEARKCKCGDVSEACTEP